MKKLFKIIGIAILSLIGFLSLYLFAAYFLPKITVEKEKNSPEEVTIFIKTNGVHTDIVVPTRSEQIDWSKEIKFENTANPDSIYAYLAIGWGDKGFYLETPTWAELKFSVAFKAAFALSTTAIHATYYAKMPEDESCKKILISKAQYARLIHYISNSLQKDTDGHFIYIKTKANYSETDAFYEANGSYNMLHTCNTWANDALKSCGQKCCFWTPFDKGIFSKYP